MNVSTAKASKHVSIVWICALKKMSVMVEEEKCSKVSTNTKIIESTIRLLSDLKVKPSPFSSPFSNNQEMYHAIKAIFQHEIMSDEKPTGKHYFLNSTG